MSPIGPPQAQDGPSGFDPGQENPPIKFGVWGDSAVGAGVVGSSGQAGNTDPSGTTPGGAGTLGINNESQGIGVLGRADKSTGTAVLGTSSQGTGVAGLTKGVNPAVAGTAAQGPGVAGTSEQGAGVVGVSKDGTGVSGTSTAGAGLSGTGETGAGVVADSKSGTGIKATSATGTAVSADCFDGTGILGHAGHSENSGFGFGFSPNSGPGVMGTSFHGSGVFGFSEDSDGVSAEGLVGLSASGRPIAGRFSGDVHVTGTLTQGAADVRIDHPLDPENHFLAHASVASPEMKNVYDGTVTLDSEGAATVQLPDYFEALNEEFQYQLTPLGDPAPELHISSPVSENRFAIAGGRPDQRVCWQITGTRRDAWARANPLRAEAKKAPEECGYYLHPEAHGQRSDRAIARLHHPDVVTRRDLRPARIKEEA
ncbi:hypothetical protein [Streptomyces bugieae]|uniref:Uncharacterized protein n=1 Tax=Streptomyces bugieae TaxID=3098223 RepID=A0ABU7NN17_9ACTN|nr:hypothetical protein [Streptomyces sp. DSM 41528]